MLGRLQHDAVAGQQGREDLPRRDGHREVPRRDHPDHADGLARRPGHLVGQLGGHRLARARPGPGRRRSGPCRRLPARRRPPRPAPCPASRLTSAASSALRSASTSAAAAISSARAGTGTSAQARWASAAAATASSTVGGRGVGQAGEDLGRPGRVDRVEPGIPRVDDGSPDTVADANGPDTPVRACRSGCNPCSAHEPIVTSVPHHGRPTHRRTPQRTDTRRTSHRRRRADASPSGRLRNGRRRRPPGRHQWRDRRAVRHEARLQRVLRAAGRGPGRAGPSPAARGRAHPRAPAERGGRPVDEPRARQRAGHPGGRRPGPVRRRDRPPQRPQGPGVRAGRRERRGASGWCWPTTWPCCGPGSS